MKEIEVKILEIDRDAIIRKLESLGAKKVFDGTIDAEFFKNSDGKKIRLRKMGNENILTYKERIEMDGVKSNDEYEIVFDNYGNLVKIFECLGFKKYADKQKERIGYRLGNIVYDIDKYEWIPWFIEVESDNLEEVRKWVELIGFTMQDTNTMWAAELEEHYARARE